MTQAEIAGGALTATNELPSKGHRLNEFKLASTLGHEIKLSDYRGRANLVLIFGDRQEPTTSLAALLANEYAEIRNEQAEVLLVLQSSLARAARMQRELKLPFPVLSDQDGHLHCNIGAIDSQQNPGTTVYITDRFGEVFGVYRTCEGTPLPSLKEILDWLEFINSQCPECGAPEWPV
jgi:peroxiredoxin